jgi:tetratricopeptide (TPR) repeat protein
MARRFVAALALLLPMTGGHALAQDPVPWDPYRAEKAVEVGRFYLKKKNYDAAIDRFLEAISHRPEYALPHRLLGEAYEKKGSKEEAVKYYEKYLEILPQANDAEKVRKKIEALKQGIKRERADKKSPT